ncbi:MAG: alkaline phosphatase family protein, partial [Alphaproteobacteria bacterium]
MAAAALGAALVPANLFAQIKPEASRATPPTLIVAISVDQFSADLFAEYRNRFTGGFARLLDGAVFPSGYQSHAATETCPGHSTLLTGMRPAHTGIVLKNWIDLKSPLADKTIYCVEDEADPVNTHEHYTVAATHLLVPTLGERIKRVFPASRTVAVSGKDRAAVMMGGHATDETWWWNGDAKGFASYPSRPAPAAVRQANASIAADLATARPALPMPAYCASRSRAVAVGTQTVGAGRLAGAAGDAEAFRTSPDVDNATLALAAGFVTTMKLGRRATPDLLNVSLSATDYIGHSYGMQGSEMCVQLASLDQHLAAFFKALDATGVDYAVVLS